MSCLLFGKIFPLEVSTMQRQVDSQQWKPSLNVHRFFKYLELTNLQDIKILR